MADIKIAGRIKAGAADGIAGYASEILFDDQASNKTVKEKIEEVASSPQTMIVTISPDGNDGYEADKTFAEIKAFLDSGGTVIAKDEEDGDSYYYLDNYIASEVVFTRNIWGSGGFSTRYYTIDNTNAVSFIDSVHHISSAVDSSSTANLANSAAVKALRDSMSEIKSISVNNTEQQVDQEGNVDIAVPDSLADLTEDSTHRTVTDAEKATWNGKQNALTFDNVPTANSNNPVKSGGVYQAIQDIDVSSQISGKEDKSNKVTSFSSPTDTQYPSAKLVNDQLATKQGTISDLSTIRSNAAAGATAYQKPGTGIPPTDLASAVQTSLGKADTAIQSVTVGTTTTGAAGSSASVTNTGTATAPVLSFTIPQGAQGIQGIQGPQGERGPQGNTGVQVDSVASIIHSIDPAATYAAADVAGADAVQDVLSEVTELGGILNGEKVVAYYISKYLSGLNYIENPLINGKEYKLTVHQTQATWMRFGFAKDNSGTDLYSIHLQNVIGDYEYTFNAPDPSVYPYMVIQKPNTDSTMEVSYTSTGLTDTIEELQSGVNTNAGNISTLQDEVEANAEDITELKNGIDGGRIVDYYTTDDISGFRYLPNQLVNGKEYTLNVHQTQATWMRFGFAKDNSGTGAYYIHEKKAIDDYEYTFNAPDPSVYPYMVVQKPNADSTMEVSHISDGIMTDIVALQGNVSDLSAQTSEIDIELNGINEQVYYTSAYLSGLNYVENELVNGREYKLSVVQTQDTWMRFGFAKDSSGTGAYYIHNKNVTDDYEYTFNAPDPSVYPYMVLQKPNPASTFEIRYIVEGFAESVEVLQEDVDGLKGNTFVKTINEQEIHLISDSYKTSYIPCPMFKGVTYLVSLKLIGHTNTPAAVVAHRSASNTEVGRIPLTSSDYASGNYVEFTPTKDAGYLLISFNSTYREPSGASMVLNVGYGEKTTVSAIDIKPLNGRKFIMLGDSITQLPHTGGMNGGVGIVEWFSHMSGAEVIRGAIGGRRLTRTGTKVTTASEITGYNIAVSFFDVIGLAEALASGDFSLQRAAYQWLVDNNYSPDVQMINEVDVLDALDMSTVDAITIFAGTNDWHNNVALQTIKDAIDSIVETLLTAYPKLTIYFFTPIVRYESNNLSNWSDTWQNTAGLTIPQYVDAIMEQAKINCVPVCDLYHGMGWTRYNVTQYIPIGDGTHPHNGFGELAAKMFGFVNSNWPKVYRTIQAD